MSNKVVAIIPARYGSTRFPRKLTYELLGKPIIIDVYDNVAFGLRLKKIPVELKDKDGNPVFKINKEKIKKLNEGRPNITDALTNGELAMVINTPHGKQSAHDDSYIRKTAIKMRIPYMTNIAAAKAALEGIMEMKIHGSHAVKSLQEYHSEIQ